MAGSVGQTIDVDQRLLPHSKPDYLRKSLATSTFSRPTFSPSLPCLALLSAATIPSSVGCPVPNTWTNNLSPSFPPHRKAGHLAEVGGAFNHLKPLIKEVDSLKLRTERLEQ